MFTISAASNPGSGALMGSHGLHAIDRTFQRMWLDPRRVIFWSSVMLIFLGILSMCFIIIIIIIIIIIRGRIKKTEKKL